MIGGARIISSQAAEFPNSGTGSATAFPASLNFGFQEEVEADDEFAHEGDEREFPGLAVGDEAGVACLQGRVVGRGGGRILRGRFEGGSRTIRERFEDDSRASGRRKRRQTRPTARAMAPSRAVGERDRRGLWPDPSGNLAGTFGDGSRTIRGRFEGVGAAAAPSAQAGGPGDGAEPCARRARPEGTLAGSFGEAGRILPGSWPKASGTIRGRRGGGSAVRPRRRPRRWRRAEQNRVGLWGSQCGRGRGDRAPGRNLCPPAVIRSSSQASRGPLRMDFRRIHRRRTTGGIGWGASGASASGPAWGPPSGAGCGGRAHRVGDAGSAANRQFSPRNQLRAGERTPGARGDGTGMGRSRV